MNSFRYHIPSYVDVERPPNVEFATTADLLKLDVFERYKTYQGFSHFALSDNCVLGILDEGFNWRVLGKIADVSDITLPQWEGWKFRAKLADGTETVLGQEVRSSCGRELTLYDGSIAIDLRE